MPECEVFEYTKPGSTFGELALLYAACSMFQWRLRFVHVSSRILVGSHLRVSSSSPGFQTEWNEHSQDFGDTVWISSSVHSSCPDIHIKRSLQHIRWFEELAARCRILSSKCCLFFLYHWKWLDEIVSLHELQAKVQLPACRDGRVQFWLHGHCEMIFTHLKFTNKGFYIEQNCQVPSVLLPSLTLFFSRFL